MTKTNTRNFRGDALTERAAKLGIEIDDFRDADGSIRELDLQRHVSTVERYSSELHLGRLLVACVATVAICAGTTWLAMHFLGQTY
jgi:hypothetical protein